MRQTAEQARQNPQQGTDNDSKDSPLKPPPPAQLWRVIFDPRLKLADRLEAAHAVIMPMPRHAQFMRYVLDGGKYSLTTTAMYAEIFSIHEEGLEAPSTATVQ